MSTPQIMEPSACTWCGIAERGHARQYADAAGWHQWAQPSQEQMLARMKARRLALTVAREGALPVPVGPEPRTLDVVEDELTGVSLSLYEEELLTERLRWALAAAKRGRARLRAQVAALLEERRTTNEALDDAVQALRAGRGDGCSCPPSGRLHQVGCPQAEVPTPERPVNGLTAAFMPVPSLEDPHDGPLAHPYRLSHDLPELGGA